MKTRSGYICENLGVTLFSGSLPELVRTRGLSSIGNLEDIASGLAQGLNHLMLEDFGILTREGFIYLPDGEVLLVRESPILASQATVEQAIENWRKGKEYVLDKTVVESYDQMEKVDSDKPLKERRVFRLRNYEEPVKLIFRGGKKEVIESRNIKARNSFYTGEMLPDLKRWLFDDTKMLEVFESRRVKEFSVWPLGSEVEHTSGNQPFARFSFFSIYHLVQPTGQAYQDHPYNSHIFGAIPYINEISNRFIIHTTADSEKKQF